MPAGRALGHDLGVKLRAPVDVHLRRAQVILLMAALFSTFLTTPVGVVLLVSRGSENVSLVAGILVLAFCASGLCGFVLGAIFLRRSASLLRLQSDFLSSVSHELRTPMTSIRNWQRKFGITCLFSTI